MLPNDFPPKVRFYTPEISHHLICCNTESEFSQVISSEIFSPNIDIRDRKVKKYENIKFLHTEKQTQQEIQNLCRNKS